MVDECKQTPKDPYTYEPEGDAAYFVLVSGQRIGLVSHEEHAIGVTLWCATFMVAPDGAMCRPEPVLTRREAAKMLVVMHRTGQTVDWPDV